MGVELTLAAKTQSSYYCPVSYEICSININTWQTVSKSEIKKTKKKTLTGERGCSVWIAPLEFLRLTCCYLSGWRSNSHLWVKDKPQMTANFAMKKIIPNDKLTDVLCLSCFQMQVELNLLCCSHLLEACLNFEGCQVQGVNYPWVCSHSAVCPNNVAANESIEADLWLHINRETKAFFKTIPEMKLNKEKWEQEGKRKDIVLSFTYRSFKEEIFPISKGIRPVMLFHITLLQQGNPRE